MSTADDFTVTTYPTGIPAHPESGLEPFTITTRGNWVELRQYGQPSLAFDHHNPEGAARELAIALARAYQITVEDR